MKKTILFITMAIITAGITGCNDSDNITISDQSGINEINSIISSADSNTVTEAGLSTTEGENSASGGDIGNGEIDIDLTQLSSSMVYAQVFDMVNNGDNYLDKTVKAKGPFSYFQETDGREFFAVLINDATACCSQGIEFVLDGDYTYPDDYPAIGTEITVVGKFNYYKENYYTYCQLTNATMEVENSLS